MAELHDFRGTLYQLKAAINDNEKLPSAASQLKLLVGKPREDKKVSDKLRKDFKTGEYFDFTRLIKEYEVDDDNPITVQTPPTGKWKQTLPRNTRTLPRFYSEMEEA